jgi:hypothetical protein
VEPLLGLWLKLFPVGALGSGLWLCPERLVEVQLLVELLFLVALAGFEPELEPLVLH